jgi:hypothetical protein
MTEPPAVTGAALALSRASAPHPSSKPGRRRKPDTRRQQTSETRSPASSRRTRRLAGTQKQFVVAVSRRNEIIRARGEDPPGVASVLRDHRSGGGRVFALSVRQGRLRADPPSRAFAPSVAAAVYPSERLNHPRGSMTDPRQLAEAVRAACIRAALDAYEEGGVLGLCAEGRWEYAISAMRRLSIDAFIAPSATGAVIEQDSEGNDGGRTGLVPGRPP